jgi:hypothetical protein
MCQIISQLVFVLRRKNSRIIVFHVSENSTNPIACADFRHATLSQNSVIIYRGSCAVFYKISIIKKNLQRQQRTAYCALHSANYQLYQLLLHCNNEKHFHALCSCTE